MYCSVNRRRGRMNDQAWKIRGEREGVAARSGRPLTLSVTSPGEGRIEAGGVHHAQHRLLNVEVTHRMKM